MRIILSNLTGLSPPEQPPLEVQPIMQSRNDPGQPRVYAVAPKATAPPSKEPENGIRKRGNK